MRDSVIFRWPDFPVSRRASKTATKETKQLFQELVRQSVPRLEIVKEPINITVVFFGSFRGDLDNRVKELLDALRDHLYDDDSQVRALQAYFERKKFNRLVFLEYGTGRPDQWESVMGRFQEKLRSEAGSSRQGSESKP